MFKIHDNLTDKIISVSDLISAKYALELMQNGTVFGSTGKILEVKKTAFLLKELSESMQQKIYEKWDFFDTDLFTECYTEFLTMLGFNNPVLHYNVSFSQSDYACFSCDSFSYEKGFVAKVKKEFGNEKLHDIAAHLQAIYKKTAYKMRGAVKTSGWCESSHVESDFYTVESDFELWLKDYSRYLLRELQDEILHQTSFEAFAETCEANEYYFNENGRLL
jgi:hypothetical protein